MRQVNGWAFKRINSGPDQNSYYHELFRRDNPELCVRMIRNRKRPALHKKAPTEDEDSTSVTLSSGVLCPQVAPAEDPHETASKVKGLPVEGQREESEQSLTSRVQPNDQSQGTEYAISGDTSVAGTASSSTAGQSLELPAHLRQISSQNPVMQNAMELLPTLDRNALTTLHRIVSLLLSGQQQGPSVVGAMQRQLPFNGDITQVTVCSSDCSTTQHPPSDSGSSASRPRDDSE